MFYIICDKIMLKKTLVYFLILLLTAYPASAGEVSLTRWVLNVTLDEIVIGRGLAAIHSKSNHQSFLYYQLKNHFFKEDMIGGGAIFASVTKKDMENQEFMYPTEGLVKTFEEISVPIDNQIKILHIQNERLTSACDILLPRLMNGEITV